jgi:hypothetical protein
MSGVEDGYSYNRFDIYEKKTAKGKTDCPKCEDECHCDDVKEGMDPVGKEDGDVNNDGKKDSSDKYLMKRRAAIGKAMKKEEVTADEDVIEGYKPLPGDKMMRQAHKAYRKEEDAAARGDGPGATKQMKRRFAMEAPDMRKAALDNKKKMKKEELDLEEGSGCGGGYQKGGVVGMENAPSIKDAKPAKKTDVKYDKKMNVMAPTIRSESMSDAYASMYEGMKEFPSAKVQDKAAMKPDTAKGEKQARKMDKVRAVMGDKEHGMGKMAKDFNKKQPVENQKRGLEKKFAAPSHEKHKNKAYKLENQRRQDLNTRYGPKKEEFEAWLTELPDEVTIFTEEELFNIFESRISE